MIIHATLGHALSRSATHRPLVTAGAVWAAHPPGTVARERHRPRANATTNATTSGSLPASSAPAPRVSSRLHHRTAPLRRTSSALISVGSTASNLRRGIRRSFGRPGAALDIAAGIGGARGVGRGGGATDRSRRVQVRVDAVGVEGSRWYLEDFLDYPVNPVPMIAARTESQ